MSASQGATSPTALALIPLVPNTIRPGVARVTPSCEPGRSLRFTKISISSDPSSGCKPGTKFFASETCTAWLSALPVTDIALVLVTVGGAPGPLQLIGASTCLTLISPPTTAITAKSSAAPRLTVSTPEEGSQVTAAGAAAGAASASRAAVATTAPAIFGARSARAFLAAETSPRGGPPDQLGVSLGGRLPVESDAKPGDSDADRRKQRRAEGAERLLDREAADVRDHWKISVVQSPPSRRASCARAGPPGRSWKSTKKSRSTAIPPSGSQSTFSSHERSSG